MYERLYNTYVTLIVINMSHRLVCLQDLITQLRSGKTSNSFKLPRNDICSQPRSSICPSEKN